MLQSTLSDLLAMNIVPILNENDVVTNDTDSKLVTMIHDYHFEYR